MCVCVERQGRHTQKDTSEKLCDRDYGIEKANSQTASPATNRPQGSPNIPGLSSVQFSCLLSVNLEPKHATCRKARRKEQA